jgi:hypothetical protein
MDCGFAEFAIPEAELGLLGKDAMACRTTRSRRLEGPVDLSELVAGLHFSRREIESLECATDKPLALENGFYRL